MSGKYQVFKVAKNENAKIYNQNRELIVVVADKINNLYYVKT